MRITSQEHLDSLSESSIRRIKKLNCAGTNVVNIPTSLVNLTDLNVSRCPYIVNIPFLSNLESLWCSDCPMLEYIPELPHVKTANFYMSKLKKLPHLSEIKILYCHSCPNLTCVSDYPNLEELYYSYPISITNCNKLSSIKII